MLDDRHTSEVKYRILISGLNFNASSELLIVISAVVVLSLKNL